MASMDATLQAATEAQLRAEYAIWGRLAGRASVMASRLTGRYVSDVGQRAQRSADDCQTVLAAIKAELARRGVTL